LEKFEFLSEVKNMEKLNFKNFRVYFSQFFEAFGLQTNLIKFNTLNPTGEPNGNNVEAVIQGQSSNSLIIIAHYDSIGSPGSETANPAADNNMTGMAILLETAYLMIAKKGNLPFTIRFVAIDNQELLQPSSEGSSNYVAYLKNKIEKSGFKVVGVINAHQVGWNCFATNECQDASTGNTFDVVSCSGDSNDFSFPEFGDAFTSVVTKFSSMNIQRNCVGDPSSTHYAFWGAGYKALGFSEHQSALNDHVSRKGNDTYEKIDLNYFYNIARVAIAFAAQTAGLTVVVQ
jgi:hypothetical protein